MKRLDQLLSILGIGAAAAADQMSQEIQVSKHSTQAKPPVEQKRNPKNKAKRLKRKAVKKARRRNRKK